MTTSSIKKNFILSTAFQILNIVTPLITAPYISRVLGSEAVGIYSYTSSLQLYFSIFAALGTATYGCREIAINRNDILKRSILFWEIELLTVVTSVVCILLYIFLVVYSYEYHIFLLVLGLKLINTMLDISWFFIGIEELKYVVYKNAFFKILGIALLFIFIKNQNDLLLYMVIMCGTTLLGTISMWFYIPKFVNKVKMVELNIFRHFKNTLVYFIPTIATTIYSNVDRTLIGLLTRDMNESAYYDQTTKILELAKSLTFVSLNSLLTSRMSFLFSENKFNEMKEKIMISIDYILFVGLGITFAVIGIANRFVPFFFGKEYNDVILFLRIFIIIIVITGISNCLETQYYTPAGRRKESTKFILIGTIVNIVFNLILIPHYSGIGAIISSIIAECVIVIQYIIKCNSFITITSLINSSYKKVASGLIMVLIITWLDSFIENDILALASELIFGGLAYLIILYLLKDRFFLNLIVRPILNHIKQ